MHQSDSLHPRAAVCNSPRQNALEGDMVTPARQRYATPRLKRHGHFERLTLQTSGTGNSQTGDDGNST